MRDLFAEFLADEAERRKRLHENHASNRPLTDDYEYIGLAGEAEFSRVTGLPMDLRRQARGDGGIDFVAPLAFTIDVKTSRSAGNLLQQQGKVKADIYVLAEYADEGRCASLLGWEHRATLARAPIDTFGTEILNHYIPRGKLRPMSELSRRIMRLAVP